jgi:hypothetical protein
MSRPARRPAEKRSFPFHPFLAAAFPVLFLYARNVRYAVTFRDVLGPLVVTLASTGLVFAIAWLLVGRRIPAAALATTAGVILFFSYGPVYGVAQHWSVAGIRIVHHWNLLLLWSAILAGALVFAIRSGQRLIGLHKVLTLVTAGLVLLNVATVAYNEVTLTKEQPLPAVLAGTKLEAPAAPADIYYIVFEEYPGEATLRDVFGFDNSPFLQALEQRGFFVAHDAAANYPRTSLSLASSLNMQYLDDVSRRTNGEGQERVLVPFIASPQIVKVLKSMGYRYVHAGSWYTPTASSPEADVEIRHGALSEFATALVRTSAILPLGSRLGLTSRYLDFRRREFDRVLFQFRELARVPRLKGPKFVFAHIINPHDPYVFDRQGHYVPQEKEAGRKNRRNFIDQLVYLNSKILELVDTLLAGSSGRRPVIVLQADEGPFPGVPARWSSRNPLRLIRQKFLILNAFYLPGQGAPSPYAGITPVNTFRLVLNRYFGAGLPLLPDREFVFRGLSRLYTFREVTDILRS